MIGHKRVITLLLCLTLSLAACLNLEQPKNKIEYYTLEYDPPAVGHHQPLPYVIRVQQFSVSPIYNSNRIIYRDKSYKRQAYTYYKWQANPAKFVTYYLSRDLQESGLFKAVLPEKIPGRRCYPSALLSWMNRNRISAKRFFSRKPTAPVSRADKKIPGHWQRQ
jgi:hypothetical protein